MSRWPVKGLLEWTRSDSADGLIFGDFDPLAPACISCGCNLLSRDRIRAELNHGNHPLPQNRSDRVAYHERAIDGPKAGMP